MRRKVGGKIAIEMNRQKEKSFKIDFLRSPLSLAIDSKRLISDEGNQFKYSSLPLNRGLLQPR